MNLQPGSQLQGGRYAIGKVLGQGGFVFLFPLSGCGQTSKPVEMPQWAYIYDLFINDGTVYALRDQADTYITTELTDAPVCYMLDSKNQKVKNNFLSQGGYPTLRSYKEK